MDQYESESDKFRYCLKFVSAKFHHIARNTKFLNFKILKIKKFRLFASFQNTMRAKFETQTKPFFVIQLFYICKGFQRKHPCCNIKFYFFSYQEKFWLSNSGNSAHAKIGKTRKKSNLSEKLFLDIRNFVIIEMFFFFFFLAKWWACSASYIIPYHWN